LVIKAQDLRRNKNVSEIAGCIYSAQQDDREGARTRGQRGSTSTAAFSTGAFSIVLLGRIDAACDFADIFIPS